VAVATTTLRVISTNYEFLSRDVARPNARIHPNCCAALRYKNSFLVCKPLYATLDPGFKWTPHQLLSMIGIIDKLYPGEGLHGQIPTITQGEQGGLKGSRHWTHSTKWHIGSTSLLSSGTAGEGPNFSTHHEVVSITSIKEEEDGPLHLHYFRWLVQKLWTFFGVSDLLWLSSSTALHFFRLFFSGPPPC
jgi:hypothetical protein